MKKLKKIFYVMFAIIINIANVVYADATEIYSFRNDNGVVSAGQTIAGWIFYFVIIAAVIALMIKGIKFIVSSPEGKADIKKEMMPWAIGIIILFAARAIINIVIDLVNNNINSIPG